VSDDILPPSRSEQHARQLLDGLNGVDQLITLPASIVGDLLADIETWRNVATGRQRAH
jgi:hypothetical protein